MMVQSTRVNGMNKAKKMARVHKLGLMALYMKVTGELTKRKGVVG